MITFGVHLLAALIAGGFAWVVKYICERLSAPGWLTFILSSATLVYVFWLLLDAGIQLGR